MAAKRSEATISHLKKCFDAAFLEERIRVFPEAYFEVTPPEAAEEHFRLLQALQAKDACRISLRPLGERRFNVSLICWDVVGVFSVAAGLFSSYGFNITQGNVWTARPARDSGSAKGRVLIALDVETVLEPVWTEFEYDLATLLRGVYEDRINEVRKELNLRIVRFFRAHQETYAKKLYPVQLDINQDVSEAETLVELRTHDSMAFLYELTSALATLEINIVRMQIDTHGSTVQDKIWLTAEGGQKIVSARRLKELRWAILLVKAFTHLLPQVPDPAVALDQMASFGKEIFEREDFDEVLNALQGDEALGHLSKIFGTSRFLWEEFIRTQHESLIPLLEDKTTLEARKPKRRMQRELLNELRSAGSIEEKVERLNGYKDREMFRIDLRHLLQKASYLEEFAEEFTDLCEAIAGAGYHLAREEAARVFPLPTVSEKAESELAVLALGKFGGRELGYASDLELLFVYTDDRDTSSERSQANLQFYTELVRRFRQIIWARQEGVFEIDLRLRPHGTNGPLAVSFELFKSYYAPGGEAWSYERQALVKLRAVAGSPWFGKEIERLRDEFIYGGAVFSFEELIRLRERQRRELVKPCETDAKISSGGLIDIEYLVQVLQIVFGRKLSSLRKTNTLNSLRALWREGVLDEKSYREIHAAYLFIRDLINALRIFRGNAKDLTVPAEEALEFVVLGRRLGYVGGDEEVRKKFRESLANHMRAAAAHYAGWMERLTGLGWEEAGRLEVRAPKVCAVSLDEMLRSEESALAERNLASVGFLNADEAARAIRRMFPGSHAFEPFAKVFDQAWDLWPEVADPGLALGHLERLSEQMENPPAFWEMLGRSRDGLRLLLSVFGQSNFLSEIILAREGLWRQVLERKDWTCEAARERLAALGKERALTDHLAEEKLTGLRKLRHEETLRIGIAEMLEPSRPDAAWAVFAELADFILEEVFSSSPLREHLSVLGLGKLGGEELNFSSDVDLLFVTDSLKPEEESALIRHLQACVSGLGRSSPDGFLYRVDLRLRPHGTAGALAMNPESSLRYYEKEADAWEYQALLKVRSVACSRAVGEGFIRRFHPLIYERPWSGPALERLREIKRRYEAQTRSRGEEYSNIKMGLGGIRDAEFTVQILQLLHAREAAEVRLSNTLSTLSVIRRLGLLSEEECGMLRDHYFFLRRIENKLQLFENRQTFLVPSDQPRRRWLARSLGFRDETGAKAEERFGSTLGKTMSATRALFEKTFFGPGSKTQITKSK